MKYAQIPKRIHRFNTVRSFALVALLGIGGMAQGQPAPQKIDLVDQADTIAGVAARAKATVALNPQRRIVIDGQVTFGSQVVTAREIVFKPKGRMVFTDATPNTSGHFFLVADRIIVEDPNNPGTISWEQSIPGKPSDRGQATVGSGGSGEGAAGGAGATGASGATGSPGQNAPELTVMVRTIGNGGLVVDFGGGEGGEGGMGQAGGAGGAGAQGSGARQARQGLPFGGTAWLPYCESGPGMGGQGGSGGTGGQGGIGGRGGNGGNVTLVSTPNNLPTLFQAVRVGMGGGKGGKGGAAGTGGAAGAGGPEGPLANFCNSAGRNGAAGAAGSSGSVGPSGEQGRAGQPFVAQLEDKQFESLFGF